MLPKIGIVKGSNFAYYKNAIKTHGGEVKELLVNGEQTVDEYIDQIHGLLLPGGGDIDPDIYGEDKHCKTKNVKRAKVDFEIELFQKATEKNIPVFGICRGIQIMNVERGGSLYQHIPEQIKDHLTHQDLKKFWDPWHPIKIQLDSQLNQITDESIAQVTSSHHQAVKVIGVGFEVTAESKDGIIEAMEDPSKEFVIGVQYHPERMWIDKNRTELGLHEHAEKLFKAFINAGVKFLTRHH